jgi:hypothetical protein
MKKCSWWIAGGFCVLVLGLGYCGLIAWHATHTLPDQPVTRDSKNFLHTPRGDVVVGTIIGGAATVAVSALLSLIGLLLGPRTWRCLVLSPGLLLIGLLGVAIVASRYMPDIFYPLRDLWRAF